MILRQDFVTMRPAPKRRSAKTIILVIIVVVVVVVVAIPALLYIMVSGFGPGESPQGLVGILEEKAIPGGVMITVLTVTRADVPWDDVTMTLTTGASSVNWRPSATEFVGDTGTSIYCGGSETLVGAQLWLNITDSSGNGYIGWDDYLTVTADSAGLADTTSQYTLTLVYEVTGGEIASTNFHF